MGNLNQSQDFSLPDATSDFIGDWCGWSRLSSCDPPGTCNDSESDPNSISFKSGAGWLSSNSHSVTLQYTLLTKPHTQVEDIQVHALNPRHVRVTYVAKRIASNGAEIRIDSGEDIVSVNSTTVFDTSYSTFSINGVAIRREENRAEMSKCTDEFLATEQKYMDQNNLVENAQVSGQVPNK